jgi:acetyltransferase-like isoleucine patch superfamily enzyme
MIGLMPNPAAVYPDNWEITAVIENDTEIDKTVLIAHFAYVMAGAKIGPWCIIGAYSLIGETCILGQNVQVMGHCTMQACTIERDVFIGPGVRILNVKHPQVSKTDDIVEDPVIICEGAVIGGGAVILPGVTIGPRAIIGAGAVVTKDIPAGATAISPAAISI